MAYLSAKLNNIISNNILLNRVVACVNDVFEIDNCKGELSELSLLYGTFSSKKSKNVQLNLTFLMEKIKGILLDKKRVEKFMKCIKKVFKLEQCKYDYDVKRFC